MLHSGGKEGSPVDFLPQVESSLVPVLPHIREIIAQNKPDILDRLVALTLFNEMVSVRNEGRSAHGRTLTLRTIPGTSVRGQVDVELWLTESRAVGERAGGVGDGLKFGLGGDVLLDERLEGGVSGCEFVDQGLRVAGPGVNVWLRFMLAVASGESQCQGHIQGGFVSEFPAIGIPGAAPRDKLPLGPKLFRTPCRAIGFSASM